ncbi:MAG: type II CAAX endopeptidase family protein [Atopococcus tabaci]|uniref:Type II CAAX endopeptidase family protein n=1 Tax=Atopococcus tabaci TaxID=269774 RepID=A0AA43UCA2_9LACT|nr:type II CAAX endopeptidase family protein [Atopococcus tabaci]
MNKLNTPPTRSHMKTAILFIIIYITVQLAPAVVVFLFFEPSQVEQILPVTIITTIISFFIGTAAILTVNYKAQFKTVVDRKGQAFSKIIIWGVLGLFLLLIGQTLASFVEVNFLNQPLTSENTNQLLTIARHYPYFILIIAFLGPIMEEFVFRKAIYGSLVPITGKIGAAVIAALIFSFMHLDGHILLYSVTSFIFTYLYEKTHSIWTPVIAHILLNSLAVLGTFTTVFISL